MDIAKLIDAAARAAVEHEPTDLPNHLKPGSEARNFVWDRHYAIDDTRRRLDAKLASATPEFRAAVTSVEQHLAEELAADNARRARVHAENPKLFKDYQ